MLNFLIFEEKYKYEIKQFDRVLLLNFIEFFVNTVRILILIKQYEH